MAGAPFAIFESTRLAIFVLNLSRRGSAVSRDLAISIFLPRSPACSHGDASHDARRRGKNERGKNETRPAVPWNPDNTTGRLANRAVENYKHGQKQQRRVQARRLLQPVWIHSSIVRDGSDCRRCFVVEFLSTPHGAAVKNTKNPGIGRRERAKMGGKKRRGKIDGKEETMSRSRQSTCRN